LENKAKRPEVTTKSVTIDGNHGFAALTRKGQKHAALWVMVAKRISWRSNAKLGSQVIVRSGIKRVDLKKLAEIK